jgi:cell wall-associated NlpC family hydrolase
MTEDEERAAVVAEARTWLRTRYHHRARIKGAGVDCAYLILESFAGAKVADWFDLGIYNNDWHLHRKEEKYLEVIEAYMGLISDHPKGLPKDFTADPGDVICFKVGHTFSHGAIVTKWPFIIHASLPARMVEETQLVGNSMICDLHIRRYSFWRKPDGLSIRA